MEHWPPREGERVFQYSRADNERWPHGEIVCVAKNYEDPESSEVIVHFFVPPSTRHYRDGDVILSYDGSNHWTFLGVQKGFIRVDGEVVPLDRSKFAYVNQAEELKWGGCNQYETFGFDQFEGNWSSWDGGNKRWEIE